MEEMPNINPNQHKEEDEQQEDQSISRRELFGDSWRRFRDRFREPGVEIAEQVQFSEEQENIKHEKDKDDDDEDDLITSESDQQTKKTKSKKSSKSTLKKNKVDDIESDISTGRKVDSADQEDSSSDDDSENSIDDEHQIEVQEIPHQKEASQEETNLLDLDRPLELFNRQNEGSDSQGQGLDDVEQMQSIDRGDDQKQADDSLTPISQVIRNKPSLKRARGYSSNIATTTPEDTGFSQTRNNKHNNRIESSPRHRHHRLIALDILNYGLALRRDNKNRRLSDRKMQRLSEEVKKQFRRAEQPKSSAQTTENAKINNIYHNETVVVSESVDPIRHTQTVDKLTIEENINRINSEQTNDQLESSKPSIFRSSEIPQSQLGATSSPEVAIERTDARVEEVVVNDEIEKIRAEYKKLLKTNDVSYSNQVWDYGSPTAPPNQQSPGSQQLSSGVNIPPATGAGKQPTNDYKQLVVPSLSGAIAGIVVFIILYVISAL